VAFLAELILSSPTTIDKMELDSHREDIRPLAMIVADVLVEPAAMCDHWAR
jgi:hypothetical protein